MTSCIWVIHLFSGSTNWILTSIIMSWSLIFHTVMYFAHNGKEKCTYSNTIYINDVAIFTAVWGILLGLTYAKEHSDKLNFCLIKQRLKVNLFIITM